MEFPKPWWPMSVSILADWREPPIPYYIQSTATPDDFTGCSVTGGLYSQTTGALVLDMGTLTGRTNLQASPAEMNIAVPHADLAGLALDTDYWLALVLNTPTSPPQLQGMLSALVRFGVAPPVAPYASTDGAGPGNFAIIRIQDAGGTFVGESFAIVEGLGIGPAGPQGESARAYLSVFVEGQFTPYALLFQTPLVGAGSFDAADSSAFAAIATTGPVVRYATLDGTFANPIAATGPEITSALFATITWDADSQGAVFAYPNGGAYTDGQVMRLWEASSTDATLDYAAHVFAGA